MGYSSKYFMFKFRFNGRKELTTNLSLVFHKDDGDLIKATTSQKGPALVPISCIEIMPVFFINPFINWVARDIDGPVEEKLLFERLLRLKSAILDVRRHLNESQIYSALRAYDGLNSLGEKVFSLLLLFRRILFGSLEEEEKPLKYAHLQDVMKMGIDDIDNVDKLLKMVPSAVALEVLEEDAGSFSDKDLQAIVMYALRHARKRSSPDFYVMALRELGKRNSYDAEWGKKLWSVLFGLPQKELGHGWKRGLFSAYFHRIYFAYPSLYKKISWPLVFAGSSDNVFQYAIPSHMNIYHLLTSQEEATLEDLEKIVQRESCLPESRTERYGHKLLVADFFLSMTKDLDLPTLPQAMDALYRIVYEILYLAQEKVKQSNFAILSEWACTALLELFLARDTTSNMLGIVRKLDYYAVMLKYRSSQYPLATDWRWFYRGNKELRALTHEYYNNRHWTPVDRVVILSISKYTTSLLCIPSTIGLLRGLAYLLFDIPFEVSDTTNIDKDGNDATLDPLNYEAFFAGWQSLMEFRMNERGDQSFILSGLTVKFAFPHLEALDQQHRDVIETRRRSLRSSIVTSENIIESLSQRQLEG